MPSAKRLIRPALLNTCIPEDLREKLEEYLKAQGNGRIKPGAYQEFLLARIQEFFQVSEWGNSPDLFQAMGLEEPAVFPAIAVSLGRKSTI